MALKFYKLWSWPDRVKSSMLHCSTRMEGTSLSLRCLPVITPSPTLRARHNWRHDGCSHWTCNEQPSGDGGQSKDPTASLSLIDSLTLKAKSKLIGAQTEHSCCLLPVNRGVPSPAMFVPCTDKPQCILTRWNGLGEKMKVMIENDAKQTEPWAKFCWKSAQLRKWSLLKVTELPSARCVYPTNACSQPSFPLVAIWHSDSPPPPPLPLLQHYLDAAVLPWQIGIVISLDGFEQDLLNNEFNRVQLWLFAKHSRRPLNECHQGTCENLHWWPCTKSTLW